LACNSNSNFKECLDHVGANPRFRKKVTLFLQCSHWRG